MYEEERVKFCNDLYVAFGFSCTCGLRVRYKLHSSPSPSCTFNTYSYIYTFIYVCMLYTWVIYYSYHMYIPIQIHAVWFVTCRLISAFTSSTFYEPVALMTRALGIIRMLQQFDEM